MAISLGSEGLQPIADAGSSRYVAQDPVVLEGTGSYYPGNSGPLNYTWHQISGPSVVISDANTVSPTISGFVQTDEIQECEFELVVSDSEMTSLPSMVKIIIVPSFGEIKIVLANESFDPDKPTIIYFGGGDGLNGLPQYAQPPWDFSIWSPKANLLSFPDGYRIDGGGGSPTYNRLSDAIISYLSARAPDYEEPIHTIGWSTGGLPAVKVAIYLNLTYQDRRYAVNRVTALDAVGPGADEMIRQLLSSSVNGEQCWLDSYVSTSNTFLANILNVGFERGSHELPRDWYGNSLTESTAIQFNCGIVGGAYWSVIGPGKNLRLANSPGEKNYIFKWYGPASSGYMDFYDEAQNPGRLPEPVTLVGPEDGTFVDTNGAVFSCEESENAVGYQLLFGPNPYRVMDYIIISDTPSPPAEIITTFPFEETWWTVRAYDQYGSTIYADPIYINAENVVAPVQKIENVTIGKRYHSILDAIDDAVNGDEIVVSKGTFFESIDFKGKNVILRSTDPNDSTVVSETVITADGDVVTFSGGEDASCVLAGFTIRDANNSIFCSAASPTIINCSIVNNVSAGIKLYMGSNPTISNCLIAGNGGSGAVMFKFKSGRQTLLNSPNFVNCTIVGNSDIGISEGMPTVFNSIIYGNGVQIAGSSAVVTYSNVQGGFPGEGNIDADPLFADAANGDYHLKSQAGRWDPASQSWVIDDVTSSCIDAGDPGTPVSVEPMPNGGIINIGAYGGTLQASLSQ